jgi:cell pole-organizing protein PopZ
MEEVLASIRRMISEDEQAAALRPNDGYYGTHSDDILRLTRRIDGPPAYRPQPVQSPIRNQPPEVAPAGRAPGLILSYEPSESAARAFSALNSAMQMRQPVGPDGKTVDELLMELMLPLLREWMDANLPRLVERLVHDEITRVSGATDSQ